MPSIQEALNNLKACLQNQGGSHTVTVPREELHALIDVYEASIRVDKAFADIIPTVHGDTEAFELTGGSVIVRKGPHWVTVDRHPFPQGCSAEYAASLHQYMAEKLKAAFVDVRRRSNINGREIEDAVRERPK